MSDEVIAPGEAPEPERSETPEQEPVTTPTPAERMEEITREIEDLEASRETPAPAPALTPDGGLEQSVHTQVSGQKNTEIETRLKELRDEQKAMQDIEDAREWAAQNGIKREFDHSRDRGWDDRDPTV